MGSYGRVRFELSQEETAKDQAAMVTAIAAVKPEQRVAAAVLTPGPGKAKGRGRGRLRSRVIVPEARS